jgi:hypothetical protein
MRVREGGACLPGEIEGARGLDPLPAREQGVKPFAVHALHDNEELGVLLACVEDLDDVRVGEARRRLRLAAKAVHELLVRDRPVHDLDRDRSVELGVVRQVDGRHAAAPELAADGVAAVRVASRLRRPHPPRLPPCSSCTL